MAGRAAAAGRVAGALGLGVVADEVLDHRDDVPVLDGPDLGDGQPAGEVRVLPHRLGQPAAQRYPGDVDRRAEQDVRPSVPRLLGDRRAVVGGQPLIEGRSQRQRGRERRHVVRAADAVGAVGVPQRRDAQVRHRVEVTAAPPRPSPRRSSPHNRLRRARSRAGRPVASADPPFQSSSQPVGQGGPIPVAGDVGVAAGQRFPSFSGAFAFGDAADGLAGVEVEEVEPAGVDGQIDGAADLGLGLGVDPGRPQALGLRRPGLRLRPRLWRPCRTLRS